MSLGVRPSKKALSSLYSALDFTDHLRLTESDLGYTTTQATTTENIDANRYRDILAYDHALLPGPYLNAAYIPPFQSTSLSFIVSQAPLPDTYTAFYTHIVKQKVRVLVNLTPLVEKGRLKSHQYWPEPSTSSSAGTGGGGGEGGGKAEKMVLGNGWKVTNESERRIDLQDGKATLIRRVIHIDTSSPSLSTSSSSQADDCAGGNGWGVTQFHLTSWPDHGVFPTSLLLRLMEETQMVPMPRIFPPPSTWIHCSAGVGRSGTLAAALIAQAVINVAKHNAGEQSSGSESDQTPAVDDSMFGRNARAEV